MKKIIILIFLFLSSFAVAQNDTTNWNLKANQSNGLFTIAENTNSFYGKSAGTINSPLTFDASNTIDTASWELVRNQSNGLFTQIQNRVTLFGKTAGQIKIPLNYNANPVTGNSIDTSTIPFLNQNNTFTGTVNTFSNKVVVGTGTSNGTADFLVMGDTTIIRGTVYRDSSYLRVEVNPFSQRLKVSVIGKTGNNMFTIDSALVSTSLAFTSGGDITSGNDFVLKSTRYLILGSNSLGTLGALLRSTADGVISLTNAGTTAFSTFTVGAGNFTAGFIRGVVDTDITAPFCRSPNGTLYYILVNDAGVITASTIAP